VAETARTGLLLDWGGVMTTNLFASFGAFCEAEGLVPSVLRDAFRHDAEARDLLIAFEEGRLEDDVFAAGLAAKLGLPPERAEGLIDRMMAGATLERAMVDAVRAARAAGVRTGLVSNSWGTTRYPHDLLAELFDGIVISGQEGMRKPAPAIYALGAQRIGLPAQACVFVDDLEFNLAPPRELGMAVVHHTEPARTIEELQGLLAVELVAP
jgi:epoxide hydrolase-like predicted phosphatase